MINFYKAKHLADVKPLYYYRDIDYMVIFPVYYEHNGKFTIDDIFHEYGIMYTKDMTKDNTSSNLNLI